MYDRTVCWSHLDRDDLVSVAVLDHEDISDLIVWCSVDVDPYCPIGKIIEYESNRVFNPDVTYRWPVVVEVTCMIVVFSFLAVINCRLHFKMPDGVTVLRDVSVFLVAPEVFRHAIPVVRLVGRIVFGGFLFGVVIPDVTFKPVSVVVEPGMIAVIISLFKFITLVFIIFVTAIIIFTIASRLA